MTTEPEDHDAVWWAAKSEKQLREWSDSSLAGSLLFAGAKAELERRANVRKGCALKILILLAALILFVFVVAQFEGGGDPGFRLVSSKVF